MHKAQKQNFSGFTLVELILVVALTLFLLTVTAQSFVSSASQFSFANADTQIEEMIREARSLAISGKAQPDYTNYAHAANPCFNPTNLNNPSCLATPAHYGVNFQNTGGTFTVTLFADNHTKVGCSSGCGREGTFDPGNNTSDYQNGYDIILSKYTVPTGMELIIPQTNGGSTNPSNLAAGASATIFFSPIFADVSTDIQNIPSTDPFFRFGISEVIGTIIRKRCSQIHLLAGISEPMPNLNVKDLTDSTSCP